MPRDENSYLLDMLLAARDALEFTADLTFPEFAQSTLHLRATLNALQNIGEAASRVSADTRHSKPEIPWGRIIAFRNRIVHGYFDIDLEILWQIIQVELPELIVQVEAMIPPEEIV